MLKKILIGISAAVFVAIWGLWYLGGESLKEQALAEQKSSVQPLIGFVRQNQPDSDNDGLKDWEEELWQTDPQNPDTDTDGTPDGEEVAKNRDPRLKAPDDELREEDYRTLALVRTATLEKQAPLLDPGSINQPSVVRYESKGLNITAGADAATLTDYGRGVAKILAEHFQKDTENEIKIVLQALESQKADALAPVSRSQELYLETARRLLATGVPASAAEIHLELANAFLGIAELDFNMEKVLAEPVLALESARVYPLRYAALLDAVHGINRYFLEQNIRFGEEDNVKITPKL